MNYRETLDFLFSSLPVWEQKGAAAYKPGLERMTAFASLLGDPQKKFRTIHVAGTNGKGSTSHMLAAILQRAGYRVGLFTSPHLVDYRERIRVNGSEIPEKAVVAFARRWHADMVALGLSFFEMATMMAFDWFARADAGGAPDRDEATGGVDVAVVEAGLGGRLDCTNIIVPELSIITNIGLEHTQYLGNTIAAIAREKAGIIKPGVPVVVGETDPESAPVFRARAAEMNAPIIFADESAARDHSPACDTAFKLDLAGDYQQKNLRTVLAALDVLRGNFSAAGRLAETEGGRLPFEIPDAAVRDGLARAAELTGLRGRWEVLNARSRNSLKSPLKPLSEIPESPESFDASPFVVCDTAHNAHGFSQIVRQIARQMEILRAPRLFMVLGFAGDKDLDAILRLLPSDAHYVLTRAAGGRAMPVEELKARFETSPGLTTIETVVPVREAVQKAVSLAGPHDMVYVGGSNFVVGELLANL